MRSGRRAVVLRAVFAALALLAVLSGCSSGDGDDGADAGDGSTDASTEGSSLQAPAFGGSFSCDDEAGDQLDGTVEAETPVSMPVPGTDLVEASVEVVEDELVVRFTTDAETSASDDPRFVVSKGIIQQPATWFEVRAYLDEGEWVVERRRLPEQLDPIGAVQERIDVLPLGVDVVGTTVSFSVPLDQLPPIDGTPTWQFGAAATDGTVYDDCNELVAD